MIEVAKYFIMLVFQIYLYISLFIFVPYYNWQYANDHGFADWLFFGEVVATSKAMAWPYFVFLKNTDSRARKIDEADVLTLEIVDAYVIKLNKKAPLNGPDNITITRLSRNENTLIYDMFVRDLISPETENFISNITSVKHVVCNQEAEKYFLSKGFGLSWNYFDSRKKYVGNVSLTPQDCIIPYFKENPKGSYFQFLAKNIFPKNYRLVNGDYNFPEYNNVSYDDVKGSCAINGLEQLKYDYPKTHISTMIETIQKNEFNQFRLVSEICFQQSMLSGH